FAVPAAKAATCLTWAQVSIGILWRLPLATTVVTHSVTRLLAPSSDPLLAKPVQVVHHGLWRAEPCFDRPGKSSQIQACWCRPWVSLPPRRRLPARFPSLRGWVRRRPRRVRDVGRLL